MRPKGAGKELSREAAYKDLLYRESKCFQVTARISHLKRKGALEKAPS